MQACLIGEDIQWGDSGGEGGGDVEGGSTADGGGGGRGDWGRGVM